MKVSKVPLLIFISMAVLAVSSSYYKNLISKERVYFNVDLPQAKSILIKVDFADQSWPKYWIQPGRVLLMSSGSAVRNTRPEMMNLRMNLIGFPSDVHLISSTNQIVVDGASYLVSIPSEQKMRLVIEVDWPRDEVRRLKVANAKVEFIDGQTGESLGNIVFVFRNSRMDLTRSFL